MNFMNMNSMNMNSNSNFMNTPYPMNQQCQTMPNYNNMFLNQMSSNNMGFNLNLNNSMPISNAQNNIKNIPNQNEVNSSVFQLSANDLDKSQELFPLVGLRNVGLTCYMNSTLQCLLHIPELNNYFLKVYPNQSENFKSINKAAETKGKLSKGYFDLLLSVIAVNNPDSRHSKSVTPNCFHNIIGELNPQFRTFDANDSKDLLIFLIQSMHEELNYLGNNKLKVVPQCDQTIPQKALDFFLQVNTELNLSIFSYLFYGIFESETQCLVCRQKFYNFQYFQILSFPLYKYNSAMFNLYKGFKDFIKTEEMRGDNQCFCQRCQKLTDSDVNTKIYSTPPYLIINLDYGKNKKYNPVEINFGATLDLTGFTDEVCTKKTYQLVAISSHIGRSGVSGHYIAYCRNPFQSDEDDIWYEFNDSSVTKVRFEDINCHSPYFLIFKRIDQNNN